MSIWVPPRVSRELQDARNRQAAELVAAARRDAVCDYWDKELQKIDSRLTLVKAHDFAEVPGLKPGYWHVIRDCGAAPPAILPLVGDDGEYVEPTSRMLEVLRDGDLQNPRAMLARRERDEAAARARAREKQQGHEDRVTEMVERLASATETRVSMNRDTPWSQNVAGRKGVKRGS